MYEETMYAIAAGSQQPFSDEETAAAPVVDWRRSPALVPVDTGSSDTLEQAQTGAAIGASLIEVGLIGVVPDAPQREAAPQPAIDEGDDAQQANPCHWRRGPGDDEADLEHLRRIASLTGNEQYQWLQVGPIGTTTGSKK